MTFILYINVIFIVLHFYFYLFILRYIYYFRYFYVRLYCVITYAVHFVMQNVVYNQM